MVSAAIKTLGKPMAEDKPSAMRSGTLHHMRNGRGQHAAANAHRTSEEPTEEYAVLNRL